MTTNELMAIWELEIAFEGTNLIIDVVLCSKGAKSED
jgi:hypothetical protein